jgi:hypothetical protein
MASSIPHMASITWTLVNLLTPYSLPSWKLESVEGVAKYRFFNWAVTPNLIVIDEFLVSGRCRNRMLVA